MKTSVWMFFLLATICSHAAPIAFEDVIAKPGKYHDQVIQIRGVFWTDGEGAFLVASETNKPDIDHAIAVMFDSAKLKKDECWRRMMADRQRLIEETKKKNPNAGWVVFQTTVILEARFEDAASIPPKVNEEGESCRLTNPYSGCRLKLDLLRVVAYPASSPVCRSAS